MADEPLPTMSRAEFARLKAMQESAPQTTDDVLPTMPRSELQNLLGMFGDKFEERLVGAPDDPTRPARAKAAGQIGGDLADMLIPSFAAEGGAGLGGFLGQTLAPPPLKPLGRVVGTMAGSALGFGAGDAGLDVARGQDADPSVAGMLLSGAAPLAPVVAKAAGSYGGEIVRSVRDSLSKNGRAVYDKLAHLIDPPGNLPVAFGATVDDFNIQGRVREGVSRAPADSILRLDKRGVFSTTADAKGVLSTAIDRRFPADFTELRKRFQLEKQRLVGGLEDIKAPLAPESVPLSGEVGSLAKTISSDPDHIARLGDIEDAWSSLLSKYTSETGTGKISAEAERVVSRELESLKMLGLGEAERASRAAAQETVKLTESYLSNKALRPASSLDDREIMKLLGVKTTKGGVLDPQTSKRYFNYENARQVIEETDALARSAEIPFEKLYQKRISLAKLAQYGPEAKDSPAATQVMTDLADAVRGFENEIAGNAGKVGKRFLEAKDELGDVFTAEDLIFRAEASAKRPKSFTQALSFAPTAIAARNVARGMASSTFRLTRANIGKVLRSTSPSSFVQIPERADKIVSAAGTISRNVSNFFGDMAARQHAKFLIPNAIVNGIVVNTLAEHGITEVDDQELSQIAQDPGFQGMVSAAQAEAAQAMAGFNEALVREDENALAVQVATLSKQYPGAFDAAKTGIPGEVTIGGKTRFPFPEDAQRYADRVRSADEIDVFEKAKIVSELNKSGTVLTVPSSLKPRKVTFPSEESSLF